MTEAVIWLWSVSEGLAVALAGVSPLALALALALHVCKLAARARGWQNILRAALPARRVAYRDAAVPYLAGVGTGAVVPVGAGQLVRIVLARRRLGTASPITIVGSLAVERAFDLIAALMIVGVALAAGAGPRGGLNRPGEAALSLLAGHPLPAAAAALAATVVSVFCGGLLRSRVGVAWLRFTLGLQALRRPRRYLCTVASWQLLSWALRLAALYWFLVAFHIPGGLPTALLVLTLQIAAGLVSFTPGGAGPQQALIAIALAGSAGATRLLAFGAGMQLSTILLDVVLGGSALALGGYGLRPWRPALPRAAATWIEVQAHVRPPGPS